MIGLENLILGLFTVLFVLLLRWMYGRVNEMVTEQREEMKQLRETTAEKVGYLQARVDDAEDNINDVRIELPTNYVTKEDLNVFKSDFLSELREVRTLVKELGTDFKEFMNSRGDK